MELVWCVRGCRGFEGNPGLWVRDCKFICWGWGVSLLGVVLQTNLASPPILGASNPGCCSFASWVLWVLCVRAPSFVFSGKRKQVCEKYMDKLCVCFCIECLSIGEVVLTWRWVSLSCYFGVYVAGLV